MQGIEPFPRIVYEIRATSSLDLRSVAMSERTRRLEDRIRELCSRVVTSEDSEELNTILPELREALHWAIERLRIRAVSILTGQADVPDERRKVR
jgi:hypothetical protein